MTASPADRGRPSLPSPLVKICGLSTPETLEAALAAGADMVGFVRFARSPRHVGLEHGRELSRQAAGRALRVALFVDPGDAELDEAARALDPDWVQLHGAETPERADAIGRRLGRPVIKAIPVSERADLAAADRYRGAVSRILLDARPAPGAALPGGNGIAFDWRLLEALARPPLCAALGMGAPPAGEERFMLSGGLNPENVAEAIAVSGLAAVDVSSGVESAPGLKHAGRIAAFVAAARAAFGGQTRRVA